MQKERSTIILPQWLIKSAHETPIRDWGVRVTGNQISDVAKNRDLRERYPDDIVLETPDGVLAPGFVNTHTHLYGVLAHGIPVAKAPSGFWPFLTDFWWPLVENRLDQEMICTASELRCADMLKSGVTTFYDCTEAPNALLGCLEAQAQRIEKYGMRAILSFEASERISHENGKLGLEENLNFIKQHKQSTPTSNSSDLISGLMCIHTTFTCSEDFIRVAYGLAQENSVLLHAHVSEGLYEPEHAKKHFGMRTIPYYKSIGVTGPGFLASQCVQIDETEIKMIADLGIRVSHMPLSNCEVGGGIAPIPELATQGATIGLGSDGYIDDFFEIMRGAFLIHKAKHLDPGVMPANLVWYLATEGGAKTLGLENIGKLDIGWAADLQLIDARLPTPLDEHNIFEQLLLYRNADHIRFVMVNGETKVENGKVLNADLELLKAHTREAARRLWEAAE